MGRLAWPDHKYTERKIAEQEDGSLAILENEIGLAFRAKLKPADIDWIGGRSEVSVCTVPSERNRKSQRPACREESGFAGSISLCDVATIRATHAIVCDAATCGTLAEAPLADFQLTRLQLSSWTL